MEEFSTFDVARIFGIERTRLQQWIDDGFITIFKKAEGKGSKAIFTRDDLYRLRVFIWLLGMNRSRFQAMDESNIDFSKVGTGRDQDKFYYTFTKIKEGNITSGGAGVSNKPPEILFDDHIAFVHVANLLAMKKDVDARIEA